RQHTAVAPGSINVGSGNEAVVPIRDVRDVRRANDSPFAVAALNVRPGIYGHPPMLEAPHPAVSTRALGKIVEMSHVRTTPAVPTPGTQGASFTFIMALSMDA